MATRSSKLAVEPKWLERLRSDRCEQYSVEMQSVLGGPGHADMSQVRRVEAAPKNAMR